MGAIGTEDCTTASLTYRGTTIERVWSFARRTCPRSFPPGVYRHRSIEEAQALREQWEAANFEEFWRRRGVRPEDVGRSVPS